MPVATSPVATKFFYFTTVSIWRYFIPSRGICLVIDSPRWNLLSCFGLYTAVYWLSF